MTGANVTGANVRAGAEPPRGARAIAAGVRSLALLAAIVVGVPIILVRGGRSLVGSANPLHGVANPSDWELDAIGHRLDEEALIELIARVCLVAVWCCLAIVVLTTVGELRSLRSHGTSMRAVRGLGWSHAIGRRVAGGLLALLPLAPPVSALPVPERRPVATAHAAPSLDRSPASAESSGDQSPVAIERRVAAGDSIYGIAAELAGADAARTAAVANWIVDHNLGRLMPDGATFTNPALIEAGWVLQVPVVADRATPTTTARHVVAGDSYWRIATEQLDVELGRQPTPAEVLGYTKELIEINAARLAHAEPALLRPGETVLLAPLTAEASASPAPPARDEPISPTIAPASQMSSTTTVPTAIPATAIPATTVPATGATLPPPTAADAPSGDHVEHRSDAPAYVALGIGASALLATGALGLVESRRRQRLRAAALGSRLAPPGDDVVRTETVLRSLERGELVARLDLGLRAASIALTEQGRHVVAALVGPDGAIELRLDAPAAIPGGLTDVWAPSPLGWTMSAAVSLVRLAVDARRGRPVNPAMSHLGETADGSLFVDLEALGLLCIDGPREQAADIARVIANGLAVSPLGAAVRVVGSGLDDGIAHGTLHVEHARSLDDALDIAAVTLGTTAASAVDGVTTFSLRARSDGESWDPAVVVSIGSTVDVAMGRELVQVTERIGRGLAVVVDRCVEGARTILRAVDGGWVLEPFGWQVTPVGMGPFDVVALRQLLESADDVPTVPSRGREHVEHVEHVEPEVQLPEWRLLVRVLGPVEVVDAAGRAVAFDRSKSVELVAWASQHRERASRSGARAALWEVDVRDATFANVVSDARRAMARAVAPPDGEEWLGRTLTDALPLHPMIATDAELLRLRLDAAQRVGDDRAAIELLRPGLVTVRDLPFAGTSYLWPDAEGLTSSLVLLATSAATVMATRCLAVGDVDGLFWATGQGLRALPGHEELIALRMRAHGRQGDLAGVRQEWESYERALQADAWGDAEPSPKLVAIRRELLSPTIR